MKKWIYLILEIALCLNVVIVIILAVIGRVSFVVAVFQSLWGILGVTLVAKAVALFSKAKP